MEGEKPAAGDNFTISDAESGDFSEVSRASQSAPHAKIFVREACQVPPVEHEELQVQVQPAG